MPPRKKRAKIINSTTGHSHGRVRGAAGQGAPEESAPVTEDFPAASESKSPPPGSLIDIIAEALQPAAQFFFDCDNGLPFNEAAKSQQKRKRELVTADFTEEQEQEMVDWLKAPEQECILNKKHCNYIKKGLKDNLWEEKAREMGKSSDQLKKWYSNMRCRFSKLKLNPSRPLNELTAREHWILHHFEFLRPHLIVQVKKRVTRSMKAKVPPDAVDHHFPSTAESDTDTYLGCRSKTTEEATMSNIAELQRQLRKKLSNTEKSRFLTNHGSCFKVLPDFDVMMSREKRAKIINSTTGHSHGRVGGAAAQGASEDLAPVTEDFPAHSESTTPPPGSLIDIIAEVLQPAAQFFFDCDNGLPLSEAAKSQKKRKRELVTADFTEEQEQEMVDWLKAPEQECILNKKHRNYIKKGLKDNLWEEKAREMGKSSDQLKKWYSNMRTRFCKVKQMSSGLGDNELTARERWILHQFEFLRPYLIVQVKKRATRSAKVQPMKAFATSAGAPQSESESDAADHHPPTAAQSDTDISLGCRSRAADDAEATMSNIAELQRRLRYKISNTKMSRFLTNHGSRFKISPVFDIMSQRENRTKIINSTTGHIHGQVRGAAPQGALEESAPVLEDVPAPSESETESTSPPPGSLIDITADVIQPATHLSVDYDYGLPFSEAAKSQQKRKRELVTADFTEEQEQEMVDWLKAPDHDFLINKKHRNYIKKDIKDNLWEQKAMEMGKSSDQLKKWYSNMRCRFGKLKQNPSGSLNELTERDRWILHHFEFLSPHLIVQVKKRVTRSAKVQLRAASTTTAGAPQSESESDAADHHPSTAAQSDTDTSLGCRSRVADDAEPSMSNIAELQRQLKNKLSNSEKSPLQRQKDTFTDFMKEVTYTFPPPMWLRFQSEVSNLLQRYQFELHQMPPMQTHQQ